MRAMILFLVLVATGCGGGTRPDRCWSSAHANFGHDLSWCEVDGALVCGGGGEVVGEGCRWTCLPTGDQTLSITYTFTRNAQGDLIPAAADYEPCPTSASR